MVRDGVISQYAIGGAIGALFYVEPFETHDLDVFVDLPFQGHVVTLGPIDAYLRAAGYDLEQDLYSIEGVPVQFLPITPGLVEEAVAEAVSIPFDDELARVMRPEHLVAIMLQVGRPAKDIPRAALFAEQLVLDREVLKAILDRYGLSEKWKKIAGGGEDGAGHS